MGTVLSSNGGLEGLQQDRSRKETAAYQYLVDCLSMTTWNKDCARHILIGCVPKNVYQTNDRPALLPGDSPLRGNPSDDGFYGHLRMELDRASFVEKAESDLSPHGWVELAEKSRYQAPWMPIVRKCKELQLLLLNSRNAFEPALPKIELSDLKRDAARRMHDVTSPKETKQLLLLAWDRFVPSAGPQEGMFRTWVKECFLDRKVPPAADKTIKNWICDLTAERNKKRPASEWMVQVRQRYPLTIPGDFKFPAYSRGCSGEDVNE